MINTGWTVDEMQKAFELIDKASVNAVIIGTSPTVKEAAHTIKTAINKPFGITGISIKELVAPDFFKEETLGKPPGGRSTKQHNLIMSMNKKRRYD